MTAFAHRSAALALVALFLAACGGAAQVSSAPAEPSAAASQAEPSAASVEPSAASAAPSEAAPSEASAPTVCVEADILAALDSYMGVEVPEDPSMDEVADALEALELEGQAAEYRDNVVAAFRGETGEAEETFKLHDAMFSLIPLRSEVNLVEC